MACVSLAMCTRRVQTLKKKKRSMHYVCGSKFLIACVEKRTWKSDLSMYLKGRDPSRWCFTRSFTSSASEATLLVKKMTLNESVLAL